MTLTLLTFLASLAFCGFYLHVARRLRLVDTPDHRSSHTEATPHGGGIPLLAAFLCGFAAVHWSIAPWDREYPLLVASALVLMLLGVIDDLRQLSVALRLALYIPLCLFAAMVLLPPGAGSLDVPQLVLVGSAAFALLSFLNIYNFMDGIDGIAASQAVLACAFAAFLAGQGTGDAQYRQICLLFAAAHLGFLVWNWPPAKMFMGDAGSIPTGFLLAALAIFGAAQGYVSGWSWLILLAAFITDAGWTLARRILAGQDFTQPHRSHAYQRMSRRWNSHLKVDMAVVMINCAWLFPLAWLAQAHPAHALILVILAYLPLLALMAKMGRLP